MIRSRFLVLIAIAMIFSACAFHPSVHAKRKTKSQGKQVRHQNDTWKDGKHFVGQKSKKKSVYRGN